MTALKYMLWLPLFACAIESGCTTEPSPSGEAPGDDADNDNGDASQQCWDAPAECLQLLECASVLVPEQLEALAAQYGEGGSCWCDNTEAAAQTCYETCVEQLRQAIEQNPTEPLCHGQYCPIEELDPEQPYGPVSDGTCPNYGNSPQLPLQNPFSLPGSVCAPKCGGIAKLCPDHPQTTADGTCYIAMGDTDYCVARCWVDPMYFGASGTQCQCGARCQPFGGPDGEGNLRGICTFE
jgi:hypothetical protein